jgi:hypothetical protein
LRATLPEYDMLSIILSTVAFFASSHYLRRYLEDMGLPRSMTRGVLIFSIALLISYFVSVAVESLPL